MLEIVIFANMKFIGNILWLLLGGLVISLYYAVIGLLYCITIIGIPFGLQAFKMAGLSLWPFGKTVNGNFGKHPIANILWFIFGGFGLAFGFLIAGLFWCITIIGIPFGKQCFKLAKLALAPFGATVQ